MVPKLFRFGIFLRQIAPFTPAMLLQNHYAPAA